MIKTVERADSDWSVAERDWENHYFHGFYKGQRYARLHLQFSEDVCYIHLRIEVWNLGVLRTMRSDFECLKEMARHRGASRMVGAVSLKGRELYKWQKMLRAVGFPKAEPVVIAGKESMMTVLEI